MLYTDDIDNGCPHLTAEEITDLSKQDYVISPFVRETIRPNFPDNVVLVKHKNDIPDRHNNAALAKNGDRDAANAIAGSIDRNCCQRLIHTIVSSDRPLPRRVGILYPDRPKEAPKNQTAIVLAGKLAKILGELRPDIEWVLIPVYQIQQTSRTVKSSDPRFENRSRFIYPKPSNPKELPADYILTDYICAKGDTLAEMYSMAKDTFERLTGAPTRVHAVAVLRTDYPNLLPNQHTRKEFTALFNDQDQKKFNKMLMQMGLSISVLTHGQMQAVVNKTAEGNKGVLEDLRKKMMEQHVKPGERLPTVPEPDKGELSWLRKTRTAPKGLKMTRHP